MMSRIFKLVYGVLLLFSFQISAQGFQGVATYKTKTTLDIDLEKSGIPADRIKQIKEMMKSRLEKTYKLTFNKTESVYAEEKQLENSGMGGRGMRFMMFSGGASGDYYKNIQTKKAPRKMNLAVNNF